MLKTTTQQLNCKYLVIALLVFAATLAIARCTITPVFLAPPNQVTTVSPSATVTLRVGINQAAPTGGQVVFIDPDSYSHFSSIPDYVLVPQGQTTKDFNVTLSSSASGTVSVDASCNGTSTGVDLTVQ